MAVTGIEVTYGGGIGSVGFHRLTGTDGQPLSVNVQGEATYLWDKIGKADQGLTAVELAGEEGPELGTEEDNRPFEWQRVGRSLSLRAPGIPAQFVYVGTRQGALPILRLVLSVDVPELDDSKGELELVSSATFAAGPPGLRVHCIKGICNEEPPSKGDSDIPKPNSKAIAAEAPKKVSEWAPPKSNGAAWTLPLTRIEEAEANILSIAESGSLGDSVEETRAFVLGEVSNLVFWCCRGRNGSVEENERVYLFLRRVARLMGQVAQQKVVGVEGFPRECGVVLRRLFGGDRHADYLFSKSKRVVGRRDTVPVVLADGDDLEAVVLSMASNSGSVPGLQIVNAFASAHGFRALLDLVMEDVHPLAGAWALDEGLARWDRHVLEGLEELDSWHLAEREEEEAEEVETSFAERAGKCPEGLCVSEVYRARAAQVVEVLKRDMGERLARFPVGRMFAARRKTAVRLEVQALQSVLEAVHAIVRWGTSAFRDSVAQLLARATIARFRFPSVADVAELDSTTSHVVAALGDAIKLLRSVSTSHWRVANSMRELAILNIAVAGALRSADAEAARPHSVQAACSLLHDVIFSASRVNIQWSWPGENPFPTDDPSSSSTTTTTTTTIKQSSTPVSRGTMIQNPMHARTSRSSHNHQSPFIITSFVFKDVAECLHQNGVLLDLLRLRSPHLPHLLDPDLNSLAAQHVLQDDYNEVDEVSPSVPGDVALYVTGFVCAAMSEADAMPPWVLARLWRLFVRYRCRAAGWCILSIVRQLKTEHVWVCFERLEWMLWDDWDELVVEICLAVSRVAVQITTSSKRLPYFPMPIDSPSAPAVPITDDDTNAPSSSSSSTTTAKKPKTDPRTPGFAPADSSDVDAVQAARMQEHGWNPPPPGTEIVRAMPSGYKYGFGVPLLWAALRSHVGMPGRGSKLCGRPRGVLPAASFAPALEALAKLLNTQGFRRFAPVLVSEGVASVLEATASSPTSLSPTSIEPVTQRLALVRRVVETLPAGEKGSSNRGGVLRAVDLGYGGSPDEPTLPFLLIGEVESCIARSSENVDAVRSRLDFLAFALEEAGWTLPSKAAQRLWQCLFLNSPPPDDTTTKHRPNAAIAPILLEWFAHCIPKRINEAAPHRGVTLAPKAIESLFAEDIPALLTLVESEEPGPERDAMSLAVADLLERFFVFLNLRTKRLGLSPSSGACFARTAPRELVGCELLWDIAMRSGLRSSAARVLLDVYTTLAPTSKGEVMSSSWADFADRCVVRLLPTAVQSSLRTESSSPSPSSPSTPTTTKKESPDAVCTPLALLSTFLERLATLGPVPAKGEYAPSHKGVGGRDGRTRGVRTVAHLKDISSARLGWKQAPSTPSSGKQILSMVAKTASLFSVPPDNVQIRPHQIIRHRLILDRPATVGSLRQEAAALFGVRPNRIRVQSTLAEGRIPADVDDAELRLFNINYAVQVVVLDAPAEDTIGAGGGAENEEDEDAAAGSEPMAGMLVQSSLPKFPVGRSWARFAASSEASAMSSETTDGDTAKIPTWPDATSYNGSAAAWLSSGLALGNEESLGGGGPSEDARTAVAERIGRSGVSIAALEALAVDPAASADSAAAWRVLALLPTPKVVSQSLLRLRPIQSRITEGAAIVYCRAVRDDAASSPGLVASAKEALNMLQRGIGEGDAIDKADAGPVPKPFHRPRIPDSVEDAETWKEAWSAMLPAPTSARALGVAVRGLLNIESALQANPACADACPVRMDDESVPRFAAGFAMSHGPKSLVCLFEGIVERYCVVGEKLKSAKVQDFQDALPLAAGALVLRCLAELYSRKRFVPPVDFCPKVVAFSKYASSFSSSRAPSMAWHAVGGQEDSSHKPIAAEAIGWAGEVLAAAVERHDSPDLEAAVRDFAEHCARNVVFFGSEKSTRRAAAISAALVMGAGSKIGVPWVVSVADAVTTATQVVRADARKRGGRGAGALYRLATCAAVLCRPKLEGLYAPILEWTDRDPEFALAREFSLIRAALASAHLDPAEADSAARALLPRIWNSMLFAFPAANDLASSTSSPSSSSLTTKKSSSPSSSSSDHLYPLRSGTTRAAATSLIISLAIHSAWARDAVLRLATTQHGDDAWFGKDELPEELMASESQTKAWEAARMRFASKIDMTLAALAESPASVPVPPMQVWNAKLPQDTAASASQSGAGRRRLGGVGLRNLGCTCYLNSTVQQLFRVLPFRRAVLSFCNLPADADHTVVRWDDPALRVASDELSFSCERGADGADPSSTVWQLQRTLAYLQESQMESLDPEPFVRTLRDPWDNSPIDVSQQKDASEFLSHLFQILENAFQGTTHARALTDVFATNVLTVMDGGRVPASGDSEPDGDSVLMRLLRGRPTPSSFLSVPVKDCSDGGLHAGLEKYVEPEPIEGFRWEHDSGGDVRCNVLKRSVLCSAPPYLILHLQRFAFDMETLSQRKVNDAFPFPHLLDLFPYTARGVFMAEQRRAEARRAEAGDDADAGVDDEDAPAAPGSLADDALEALLSKGPQPHECQYVLSGVVIHSGTAQGGHYWSLVRDRTVPIRLKPEAGPPPVPSSEDGSTRTLLQPGEALQLHDGCLDLGPDQWFEYNDSRVRPFSPSLLESQAFGGDYSSVTGQSAFLLVYDRIPPQEVRMWSTTHRTIVPEPTTTSSDSAAVDTTAPSTTPKKHSEESKDESPSTDKEDDDLGLEQDLVEVSLEKEDEDEEEEYSAPLAALSAEARRVPIPRSVFEEAWADNLAGDYLSMVGSAEYRELVSRVVELEMESAERSEVAACCRSVEDAVARVEGVRDHAMARLLMRLLLGTLVHVQKSPARNRWWSELQQRLRGLLLVDADAAVTVLRVFAGRKSVVGSKGAACALRSLVLECPSEEVRRSISSILALSIERVAPLERPLYLRRVSPGAAEVLGLLEAGDGRESLVETVFSKVLLPLLPLGAREKVGHEGVESLFHLLDSAVGVSDVERRLFVLFGGIHLVLATLRRQRANAERMAEDVLGGVLPSFGEEREPADHVVEWSEAGSQLLSKLVGVCVCPSGKPGKKQNIGSDAVEAAKSVLEADATSEDVVRDVALGAAEAIPLPDGIVGELTSERAWRQYVASSGSQPSRRIRSLRRLVAHLVTESREIAEDGIRVICATYSTLDGAASSNPVRLLLAMTGPSWDLRSSAKASASMRRKSKGKSPASIVRSSREFADDSQLAWRTDCALSSICAAIERDKRFLRATEAAIRQMLRAAYRNDSVAKWLQTEGSHFVLSWEQWLRDTEKGRRLPRDIVPSRPDSNAAAVCMERGQLGRWISALQRGSSPRQEGDAVLASDDEASELVQPKRPIRIQTPITSRRGAASGARQEVDVVRYLDDETAEGGGGLDAPLGKHVVRRAEGDEKKVSLWYQAFAILPPQ